MSKNAKVNVLFGADLKQFSTTMQNAEREIKKMGRSMKNVGKNMTIGITAPLLALGAVAIKAASDLETLETSLSIMTGSAEDGAKALKDLSDFTASTPFQLEEVGKAAKQLLAFGFNVDEVKQKLKVLGDVSAGSGNQIGDLSQIFGQVSAAGKLTGERFNQLQERAVPIGAAIAKTMGIAETSVKEFVSKGKVDFATFETAFNSLANEGGLFAGAMDKQSKTLAGVFSTLKDNVQLAFGEMGLAISESVDLKELVSGFTKTLQNLVEGFRNLSPGVKKFIVVIGLLLVALGPLMIALGFLMTNVVPGLITAFAGLTTATGFVTAAFARLNATMLANPITLIGAAVVGATYAFVSMEQKMTPLVSKMETFINMIKSFGRYGKFLELQIVDQAIAMGEQEKATNEANRALAESIWNQKVLEEQLKKTTTASNDFNAAISRKPAEESTAVVGSSTGSLSQPGIDTDFTKDFEDIENLNLENARNELILFQEEQQRLADTSIAVGGAVADAFADMANNFVDSLGLADDGFQGFVKNLAKTIIQLIAQMLAASMSQAIAGATASGVATGPGAVFTTPAFIATAIGGVLAAFAAIPSFADGGIIYGPTTALVGEYAGASSNPEVIAPLNKLKDLMGTNNNVTDVNVHGAFEIDGRKLRLVLDRTDQQYNRLS